MPYRPSGVRADVVETDLSRLFYGGGPVGGHRHRLQQLNQSQIFLASFLGAAALADVAHERVKAASPSGSNRPNCRFYGKFVAIAMQGNQLDRPV